MINLKNSSTLMAAFSYLMLCASCFTQTNHQADYYLTDTTVVQTGGTRMIPVKTEKGTYHVWTKRIGNNPRIKVLLLAGGPGFPHDYLEAFEGYFPAEGIEFYYYDELGNGYSDKPGDSSRYTIPAAVEEVEQVRQALHLDKENMYLFGHSWGGILAMEYALKYQQHLKGLIISNMSSSAREFNRYVQEELTKFIPRDALDTINDLTAKKDFTNPKYMKLVTEHFYAQFICRLPEWPEPLNRAFTKINQPYYLSMQGPSEFGLSGNLSTWDATDRLKDITVPTLTIGGKYDEMDPIHMKWMSEQVKDGQYLYCDNGSHLSMYDQQPYYMHGIIRFIKEIDKR